MPSGPSFGNDTLEPQPEPDSQSESKRFLKSPDALQKVLIDLARTHAESESESKRIMRNPLDVQKVLIDLARTELPPAVGGRLAKLVVSCLSCLEGGFSQEFDGQRDRVETGMNFMVTVKASLADICV